MQALADRRAQRDHPGARIYGNLHTIVEAALAMAIQTQILRTVPQKYKDAALEMEAAVEKLKAVQLAMRLDRETDPCSRASSRRGATMAYGGSRSTLARKCARPVSKGSPTTRRTRSSAARN